MKAIDARMTRQARFSHVAMTRWLARQVPGTDPVEATWDFRLVRPSIVTHDTSWARYYVRLERGRR